MEKRLLVGALAAALAATTAFAGTAERLAALSAKGAEDRLSLDELHEVRALLRPLAEAGDTEAQIGLANSYFRTEIGRDSQDLKKETPPFKEFSYTDYYFDYYHYRVPCGTNAVEVMEDQNPVEARKWYRRAADAGSPRAMLFLALTAARDSSRQPNDRISTKELVKPGTEARRWLEKAAQNGSALACFVFCEKGEGIISDEERLRWLRKGANLGSPGLQTGLAAAYAEGYLGLPKDQSECLKWLRKAAESGFRAARKKMPAMCLEAGQYEEAEMWFDKLGDNKSSYFVEKAMKKCSEEGKTSHVLQWALRLDALYDADEAKQAKPSGSRHSESRRAERAKVQHAIATIYHWGAREQGTDGEWTDTVKANTAEAMRWYRKAAENEDYESIFALCEYYADNKNLAEAVKWLKRGEKIEGEHQGRMKYMLFECLLIRDNRMGHEANRLLEEAAKLGDSEAVEALKLRDDAMNSKRRRKIK